MSLPVHSFAWWYTSLADLVCQFFEKKKTVEKNKMDSEECLRYALLLIRPTPAVYVVQQIFIFYSRGRSVGQRRERKEK